MTKSCFEKKKKTAGKYILRVIGYPSCRWRNGYGVDVRLGDHN